MAARPCRDWSGNTTSGLNKGHLPAGWLTSSIMQTKRICCAFMTGRGPAQHGIGRILASARLTGASEFIQCEENAGADRPTSLHRGCHQTFRELLISDRCPAPPVVGPFIRIRPKLRAEADKDKFMNGNSARELLQLSKPAVRSPIPASPGRLLSGRSR